ncbi:hypothetical protein GCM10017674_18070 [Streptomyces gardneri]|nr:hypothetical protein GCM10017674_18070 [Streptomyces gardneri]
MDRRPRPLPDRRHPRRPHLHDQAGTGGSDDHPGPGCGNAPRWVAGDEVYGDNPHLRAALEDRRTGYVLAVSSTHQVTTVAGKFPAKAIVAKIPKRAWQRRSAGAGAKGERYYDWAQADIHGPADRPGHWWLLVRRNRRSGELAFYRCFSPHSVPLSDLVRVAGRRWTVEETFQAGKGLAGLDEHQVRRWTSWHRWVTLAMLAHAFLAVTAAAERRDHPPRRPDPLDLQRDPTPVHHPDQPGPRPRAPTPLVTLATPTPGPRPRLPLPTASSRPAMKITIYGWSTN